MKNYLSNSKQNEYLKLAQAQLNADKANEISAANSIRSERLRQREIDKINKEYAAKQAEINERVKRAKRTQTVINTATSIMEVWSDEEMSNWGKALMSVMVARLGAAQLRTIDAAKYEQGGLVGGRRHSQGGTMIEAERGEYVISRRGVEAAGIEALNRINAGGGGGNSEGQPAPAQGSGGSGGGGSSAQTGSNGNAGSTNTGGGGGGIDSNPNPVSSGAGGSGIVIIRYKYQ